MRVTSAFAGVKISTGVIKRLGWAESGRAWSSNCIR